MSVRTRTVIAVAFAGAVVTGAAVWIGWTHAGTSARQGEAAPVSGGDTGVVAITVALLISVPALPTPPPSSTPSRP